VKGKGELAEVSQTLNDMMDRLQEAFQSQQEFVNDASHELRTPLTIIQGHLVIASALWEPCLTWRSTLPSTASSTT
jgi:signal transduction histidine kinase